MRLLSIVLFLLTAVDAAALELQQLKSFEAEDRKNYLAGMRDGFGSSHMFTVVLVSDSYVMFVEQFWFYECIKKMNVAAIDAAALAAFFDKPDEDVSTWFNRYHRKRCEVDFNVVFDYESEHKQDLRSVYERRFPDRTDASDGYNLWSLLQSLPPE